MDEDNIKYTEEELKEMIKKMMEQSITVDEAITQKLEDDLMLSDSFKNCEEAHETVSKLRFYSSRTIQLSILRLRVVKLISYILNLSSIDLINDNIVKFNASKNILINEKELLKEIKNSIVELKKYNVGICNYDICVLLSLLVELNELIMLDLNDYMHTCELAVKGITYYSNKTYKEELKELEEKIDSCALRLGLNKRLGT